ncbi:MAG TPA: hypothetical protein VGB91_03925, partial [Rhizomicrobium sp.]
MNVREAFEAMDYGAAPEGSGPAEAWLARHGASFGHFIGGAWVAGTAHFDSLNPATGGKLASIAKGS